MRLKIYTDGASWGNPGPAAIGIIIRDDHDQKVAEISRRIGVATNNQAEYHAVIIALQTALSWQPEWIDLYLDSELVVIQINGQYKVRSATLLPLFQKAIELTKATRTLAIIHIPREQNKDAHTLAEAVLKRNS